MTPAGRVVVVTGGSRGLGAALVAAFLAEGDSVATCSRSATARTDEWAEAFPDRFAFAEHDLRNPEECAAFIADVLVRFGRIDVLVNNAGVARTGVLPLLQERDLDDVIDSNLKATLQVTRAVSRQMLRQRSGRIVNVSSVVGLSGYRGMAVYSATKAGLDGLTRALARELGGRGITVNSVAPGYLRTDMSYGLDEAQLEQITRRIPVGRLGTPADVAAAVLFLCSSSAEFITGQVIVIDGGLTA